MRTNHSRLKIGSSIAALIASLAIAAPAGAQDAAAAAQGAPPAPEGLGGAMDEIVVTGSSIRGVAPVGSNLVSVGQDALAKVAATTSSELVNTVPAITTAGATPQAQSSYSYYAPQIHSLAGSGSNTTLALIDGLRMPGGGLQHAQTDPNIIPTPALQRVEVLADGASSIYGSDAVAGVVNFITRKRFDGIQVNGRIGFADHYRSYDVNGIWGTQWDTGGVYVAAQFLKQDEITNDKRGFLSRGDYRDIGGSNTNTFNCSPATLRGNTGPNVVYPNADAATTLPNNQAQYGFCNGSVYGSAIPGVQREGVLVVVNQDFGDRLSFTGKLVYNHLTHFSTGTPGTINGATAFGPGSPANRTTQINPYYRNPAGTDFTSQTINWLALTPDGDYGTNNYENQTFYVTAVFDYKLTDKWTMTASGALARSNSFQRGRNTFCAPCALYTLNGSSSNNGNQSSVLPGLGGQTSTVAQALTPASSLDVWNPLSSNRTPQAVWDYIYTNNTNNEHQNNMYQLKLEAQGPVFSLPAGEVRVAAGFEYEHFTQDVYGLNLNGQGTGYQNFIMNLGPRRVKSGYVEIYVPVISEDMEVPLVRAFDLSISGRLDAYSDSETTKNPKIAANWTVTDWLKIRGNWAESFVAPPLNQVGDPRQGYLRGATGTGSSAVIDVPVASYPEVKLLPGCETATVTCRVGANTGREGLDRSLGAGFAGVVPQTGSSWSVGMDLKPFGGFTANVTYWANVFKGGVASPAQPLILNSAALHDRLTICPNTCTADQIRVFTNVDNGATTAAVLPTPVYFLINRDVGNVLNLNVQGIDAQFTYRLETDSLGIFTIGNSITYFTKFDQDFGDASFSILNTSGYNSQFPSIQTKGRAQLGWEKGPIALDLFMNYTGSYRNWIQTSVIPVEVGPTGNPVGGGDKVRADINFDMHLAYNFTGGALKGSQVYLDIKNMFDRNPPFYNGNTTGAGGVGAWGFNGFTSNLLGRLVSLGFRASFERGRPPARRAPPPTRPPGRNASKKTIHSDGGSFMKNPTRSLAALVLLGSAAQAQIAVSANDGKQLRPGEAPTTRTLDTVSLIDMRSYPPRLLGSVAAPASMIGAPAAVAIAPGGRFAVVTCNQRLNAAGELVPAGFVSVIDISRPAAPALVQSLEVSPGAGGVAINAAGTLALVTSNSDDTVAIFSIRAGGLARRHAAARAPGARPTDIVFARDGRAAYVVAQGAGEAHPPVRVGREGGGGGRCGAGGLAALWRRDQPRRTLSLQHQSGRRAGRAAARSGAAAHRRGHRRQSRDRRCRERGCRTGAGTRHPVARQPLSGGGGGKRIGRPAGQRGL